MLYDECGRSISLVKNLVSNIKHKLFEIGLGQVGVSKCMYILQPIIHLLCRDSMIFFFQNLVEQINSSSRCHLYKHIIIHFSLQYYLEKSIPKIYKKQIFRMSSHNLAIESGRHTNVTKENRLCKLCCADIEDEFHFVLKCPQYRELRLKYI